VTQAGGPEAVGFKGRIFWWCMWWLSFSVDRGRVRHPQRPDRSWHLAQLDHRREIKRSLIAYDH
jgi:hypothetical protein